ncbi:MAG: hypothetical protein NT074_05130 [Methanomicrobiales archaeon]|nr:hypothetical protein [Methanomicrobiales archaeon]
MALEVLNEAGVAFLAGLFTPLGAVCVLPLYPAYLAYLVVQARVLPPRIGPVILALVVTAGVLTAMAVMGAVIMLLMAGSLSVVMMALSPFLYAVLAFIGALLIAGSVVELRLPSIQVPALASPYGGAFVFGLFFGVLVLPCNPGPVLLLFALGIAGNSMIPITTFLAFGIGMATPLFVLSLFTAVEGSRCTSFLVKKRRVVQAACGTFILAIALFYLITSLGVVI